MFEKILFPTDFSTHAQAELECISGFPDIREIVLLHIVKKFPIPQIEMLVTNANKGYLDEAKQFLKTLQPNLSVKMEMVSSDDIPGAILKTAVKQDTDLIVINGYVKSCKVGILLGRVPATILCRVSRTNVLVMPNRLVDTLDKENYNKFCRSIFSRILCPTDFSEFSTKTVACAGRTKGLQEIILIHVLPDNAQAPARADAGARLEAIGDMLVSGGVKVKTVVTEGEPAREIVRVADAENVSVIWMNTSSKGCLVDFLSGSLVQDMVMNGKRPVLVVRAAN